MFIMNIFLSNKKELFLGSRNQGLYRYDSITDGFVHLFQFTGKQLNSHSNNFEYITEDKKGCFGSVRLKDSLHMILPQERSFMIIQKIHLSVV